MSDIRKIGAWLPITREVAIAHGLVQRTPQEQAEHDAWLAEYRVRHARYEVELQQWTKTWAKVMDPVARAVLEHHHDIDARLGSCITCDDTWPCATAAAVMEALGYTTPDEYGEG